MTADHLPAVPDTGSRVAAEDVARWERQIAEVVRTVEDIKLLNEWRARAAALETYLRGKELQRPMMGAQRRVEARIGQLLGDPEEIERPDRPAIGHDLSMIKPDDRVDWRILALAFDACPLTQDEWRKSRRTLVSLIRQRAGLIPDTPPLPDGIYRCIVADPPWKLDTGPDMFGGTGEAGHDTLAYEQMSLEEIRALPVEEHAADDAHLYLWTTNRYVEHAYDVARAWGFKPSVLLVWAKTPRGIGLGDAFRLTTEFILYARRGSLDENCIVETTWFNWPRGRHSEKPDGFYALAESVSPAPYGAEDRLELFARAARPGWTAWGHEAPADEEAS
jgi:N6-adenosine-specific RNA methylase IME4